MPFSPTNELVSIAWLKGITGLPSSSIGTTLPGDNATWSASGFVQVGVVGGTPHLYVPVNRPVVQLDLWAVNPSSARPPWGKANQLAETIKAACYGHQDAAVPTIRTVTMHVSGYKQARVINAYLASESRRMPADEARYARYTADLGLEWVVVP